MVIIVVMVMVLIIVAIFINHDHRAPIIKHDLCIIVNIDNLGLIITITIHASKINRALRILSAI
ncbi:hypothetical protein KDH_58730 [Dictyobacter sp. S3.2.2.5]|uniref:Uncharacterized protein n=1 Tax=Dictyobacter halimunensis TaxID=3026934 RepID=A0ABQ6FXM8_9CHLR|nr:hypothetical protein KDH_58730 [Dictyobacter sp. S3.2.2.5]